MNAKESGSRYHEIFNTMDEMFQLLELIYDENGKVIDYIYLEVNPAFERLVGRERNQVDGRRFGQKRAHHEAAPLALDRVRAEEGERIAVRAALESEDGSVQG
jgi:PAS domain S-box-containing protein